MASWSPDPVDEERPSEDETGQHSLGLAGEAEGGSKMRRGMPGAPRYDGDASPEEFEKARRMEREGGE